MPHHAPRRRCVACSRMRTCAYSAPDGTAHRRCRGCFDAGAVRGPCAACGAVGRVVQGHCAGCAFSVAALAGDVGYHHPLENSPDAGARVAAAHLAEPDVCSRVHAWLVPMRPRCTLHAARVAAWRLHGDLLGLLPGCGPAVFGSPAHPRGNPQAVSQHLGGLAARGAFPPGTAPVVLLGLDAVPPVAASGHI